MGERGPSPKRESQRRRTNKPETPVVQVAVAGSVVVPEPDLEWHAIARMLWDGMAGSGQSAWYEPSDWAAAFVLCESVSREFCDQPVVSRDGDVQWVKMPPRAAALAAWRSQMAALMVSEGDRRRASVELTRESSAPEEDGDVTHLNDIRARLRGAG